MAFGQSPGPSATAKQLHELAELIAAAGHADFRDARGPLGLNQRQAAGKFTRDEAEALIAQLQADSEPGGAHGATVSEVAPAPRPPVARAAVRPDRAGRLRSVPSTELAAELQRRGWVVMEP